MSRAAAKPATFAPDPIRRSLIAKVKIAQKQLGLDEDLYRNILLDLTRKRSAADCTREELVKVLKHFEARGFTAKAAPKPGKPKPADHRTALKARALWISLHQLGAIDDPSEGALEAFARRQLKVEKLQWANEALAYRLIEALKAIGRRHGWDSSLEGVAPASTVIVLKKRLVAAILAKLKKAGIAANGWNEARAHFEFSGERSAPLLLASLDQVDSMARVFGRVLNEARAKGLIK